MFGHAAELVVAMIPALATARWAERGSSPVIRRARSSAQRRLVPDSVQPGPQLVLPTPSTTELPKGTIVPRRVVLCTSTALTR